MSGTDGASPDGVVYLPAHGVGVVEPGLVCGGLVFTTLDANEWSLIETNWMVDQESDRPAQSERAVALMPYQGEVRTTDHPAFTDALARFQRVASTARLVRSGTWIDGRHLAVVARSQKGTNVRMVGSSRPRLWGAAFGDRQVLRGRRREFGDRVECRPAQVVWPQGPEYTLDRATVEMIEEVSELLGEMQAMAPDHAWWAAQRGFDRGNDIFLPRRARMTALFQLLEMLYGPYRPRGEAGLGAAITAVGKLVDADPDEVVEYVEGDLRAIRNHVAHGRPLPDDVELARDEQTLLAFARTGLLYSAAWIGGRNDPDGPTHRGPSGRSRDSASGSQLPTRACPVDHGTGSRSQILIEATSMVPR
jgi:hypothetical protein